MMKSRDLSTAVIFPAILADFLAIMALFTVFPILVERFSEPTGMNALILSLGFLIFCVAVYWLRRLIPVPGGKDEWLPRGWRTVLAVFFALTMSLAIAWQLGFFESGPVVDTRELGEGGSAVYFVFAPGAWLGFALIYVLVLAFTVTPRIEAANSRRGVGAFLSLLAINGMFLLLESQAYNLFAGRSFFWLPVAFVWFLGLFLPPHLLYITRTSEQASPSAYLLLGTFLVVVAIGTMRIFIG
jgi:hypothetical protein